MFMNWKNIIITAKTFSSSEVCLDMQAFLKQPGIWILKFPVGNFIFYFYIYLVVYPDPIPADSGLWEIAASLKTGLPEPSLDLWEPITPPIASLLASQEVPGITGDGADMPDVESGRWSLVSFLSDALVDTLYELVSPSLISEAVESLTTSTFVSLN